MTPTVLSAVQRRWAGTAACPSPVRLGRRRQARARLTLTLLALLMLPVAATAEEPPLIAAVKAGDLARIRRLSAERGAVNAAEPDGTTALHWAVRGNDAAIVQRLLRAGAKADAANRYGVTPLSLAALNGNAAVVGMLLEAGARADAPMAEGQTVLMAAARAGNADVLTRLLAAGADVNARETVAGETALMWAALENHAEAVKVLVAHGADRNARSKVLTFSQFKFGDGIVARPTVLPKGGWTPLMYAARENAVAAAQALAETGADLNATDPDGTTALIFAIINAHYDLAAMLVAKGADPNVADVTGMTALYAVADMHTLDETVGRPNPKPHSRISAPDLAKALLARGADPNLRLRGPILDRVHNDGDVNLGEGSTALMRAAKDADVPLLQVLLDGGASVDLTTKTQKTALMYAASRLNGFRGTPNRGTGEAAANAVALLVNRGADIHAVDASGQSALHLAAARAEPVVVRQLVASGATLTLRDQQGRTPLDLAMGVGGRGRGGKPPAARTEVATLLRELATGRTDN
jgi:ankyrin repeat protein